MTATEHDQSSRPVVSVGVCGVPDEAVEAARNAAVRAHHEGFVAAQRAVGISDPVAFDALSERTRRLKHQQIDYLADAALAAAVPHVREAIAREIEAYRSERFAEYGNEETGPRNYDWALTRAADIARGASR